MVQLSLFCVLLALTAATAVVKGTNSSNILRGRDGIPGRDGRDGRDGLQGPIGPQIPIGMRGEKGHKGDVGPTGPKGDTPGQKGSKGDAGSSGVTYIRWGRTVCPQGTSLVYTGVTAGTKFDTKGGTSDTLCLAGNLQYKAGDGSSSNAAQLSGGRIGTVGVSTSIYQRRDSYFPYALCYTSTKSTSFMLPGRYTCPSGWSTENAGYMMSERTHSNREGHRDTICMDQNVETATTKGSAHASMLYLMQVTCIGLNCPPFNSQKPLTCVVCSK